MRIVRKVKDAAAWVEKVVDHEAPRPAPADKPAAEKPAPKKPGDAKLVRGLGERLGIAGLVLATVLAAGAGLAGCRPDTAPSPSPTCSEPASWCHRGDAAEAVQR